MTILQSIILGIIEGFTEFLPISSTAHLILSAEALKIPSSEFLKTFNISIQLGAILAVVILYWKKIWSSRPLIGKIFAAFIPTSIIGLALYKITKNYLMESLALIALTLFLGGIILIIFEKAYKKKHPKTDVKDSKEIGKSLEEMTYKQAAIIGTCQTIAMVPGVSRSATTIISGLSLGLSRQAIVEFSFLLAIPTMAAATGLDLIKSREVIMMLSGQDLIAWAIGFILSFITAIIGVKFLLKFIKNNDFIGFAWYRIILGIIIGAWLIF